MPSDRIDWESPSKLNLNNDVAFPDNKRYVYLLFGIHDRIIKVIENESIAKGLPYGAIRYEEHAIYRR